MAAIAGINSSMKIDRELIEKYHRNECTAEESDAVETWLFSVDSDVSLQLPVKESKADHKSEMWKEISTIFPQQGIPDTGVSPLSAVAVSGATPAPPFPASAHLKNSAGTKITIKKAFWSGAIAASLITAMIAVAAYQMMKPESPLTGFLDVNNTSFENVRHVEASGYHISVGPNTTARIDNLTGMVDLTGSMLICPKKDIALSFEGNPDKIIFKKGHTYILLRGKDGNDKILIVSRQNLMDLPPVLQKQIIHEFKI